MICFSTQELKNKHYEDENAEKDSKNKIFSRQIAMVTLLVHYYAKFI